MYLSEEYLRRHGLIVPVVKHINQGNVFLKTDNHGVLTWRIMNVRFRPDERHPGHYLIKNLKPRHDAFGGGRDIFEVVDSFDLDWDRYEEYLLELPERMPGVKSVKDSKEVALAGWEIFAYVCDSSLAKFAIQESFYKSLDTELPLIERYKSFQEASAFLMTNNRDCFMVWAEHVVPYIRQYCYWLAVILEGRPAHVR